MSGLILVVGFFFFGFYGGVNIGDGGWKGVCKELWLMVCGLVSFLWKCYYFSNVLNLNICGIKVRVIYY